MNIQNGWVVLGNLVTFLPKSVQKGLSIQWPLSNCRLRRLQAAPAMLFLNQSLGLERPILSLYEQHNYCALAYLRLQLL
jgi:hypothetical protein